MNDRDQLAALVASRRGVTAKVNDTDREVADRILAAGTWLPHIPESQIIYPEYEDD